MKEQDIQSQIIHLIQSKYSGYVVNVVKASKSGVPDLLACIQGRLVAVEVKVPGKAPRPLQQHNLDMIIASGGIAMSATSKSEVELLLDQYFGYSIDV